MNTRQVRPPTLLEAAIPVVLMIVFLGLSVVNAADLPEIPVVSALLRALSAVPVVGTLVNHGLTPHIPLIFGTVVAALMGLRFGLTWREIERGMVDGIVVALPACLTLMVIGMLIGTWIAGGIVPMMIHLGLQLISPSVFLVAACGICALVSLATGSSWSTAGTVGIALIGVGQGLDVPTPLVAGAIISGAYFGDKMSPISDTTVLAPSVAGTDVFTHVRHMAYTSGPSLLVALALYALIGRGHGASSLDAGGIEPITQALGAAFTLHWGLLIPPVLVIGMVACRIPALPALLAGSVLGGATGMLAQGLDLATVMDVAQAGFKAETGMATVDTLLNRGGMESMLRTVALILCALAFGGVMERTGMLGTIAAGVLRVARTTGSLILATVCTCLGMNVIAPDQYLAIVVPGRMYREAYHRAGLHPKNLSRALEDAGTLSSPLIPWNSCGAYMWATLGVFPFAYLPYAFFNLLNPIFSVLFGYLGWTIQRLPAEPRTSDAPAEPRQH